MYQINGKHGNILTFISHLYTPFRTGIMLEFIFYLFILTRRIVIKVHFESIEPFNLTR